MRIIPANFYLSSFKTVGGDRGDRWTDRHFYQLKSYWKIKTPPSLRLLCLTGVIKIIRFMDCQKPVSNWLLLESAYWNVFAVAFVVPWGQIQNQECPVNLKSVKSDLDLKITWLPQVMQRKKWQTQKNKMQQFFQAMYVELCHHNQLL